MARRPYDFIEALAEYLGGPNQAKQSIKLQMGDPDAKLWAKIRNASPIHGYPTVEETRDILAGFLNVNKEGK